MTIRHTLLAALAAPLLLAAFNLRAATDKDFQTKTFTDAKGTTPYRLYVAKEYNGRSPLPLVVFLHGAGEKGTDNQKQINNRANGAMVFADQKANPCIMIAPQCGPGNASWASPMERQHVPLIVQSVCKEYKVDENRIYITGLSLGGNGTWVQLADNPKLYAAAIPICGWGAGKYDGFKGVPIWAFHAADDPTVKVNGTDDAVKGVRAVGGNPIYTRYEKGGHGSWVEAYKTQAAIDWLFAQKRGAPVAVVPSLTIKTPSIEPSWTANAATVKLTGIAVDPKISTLNWTNSLGGEGTVTGTTQWTAADVGLKQGANIIRVMATTTAYSDRLGGSTTFSDSIAIASSQGPAVAKKK
jgi:poly(3-hydroxybutyrate) depolymerase